MKNYKESEPRRAAVAQIASPCISVEGKGSNISSLSSHKCEERQVPSHPSEATHSSKHEEKSPCRTAKDPSTKTAILSSSLREEQKSSFPGEGSVVLEELSPASAGRTGTKSISSSLLPQLGDARDADGIPSTPGSEIVPLPSSLLRNDWQMQFLGSGGVSGVAASPAAAAHKRTGCEFAGALVTFALPLVAHTNDSAMCQRETQHDQGQKQQQLRIFERPLQSGDSSAPSMVNSSIILTALRRHLRSLMRIMYAKLPFFTPTEQKHFGLLRLRANTDCGESYTQLENSPDLEDRHSWSGSLPLPAAEDRKRCRLVAGYDSKRRFMKESNKLDCLVRGTINFVPSTQRELASPSFSHSSASLRPPVVDRSRDKESSSDEATFKIPSRRAEPESFDVAGAVLSGPCVAAVLAQSWEGQRLFHNDNLLVCPLNELCDYLCIFLPFLGMSFTEVSAQHPNKLQHVRLQLLMLRNKQQRQPQLGKHSRHLMQRRWPLVQGLGSTALRSHCREGTLESPSHEAQSTAPFSIGIHRPTGQAIVPEGFESHLALTRPPPTSSLPTARRDFTGGESLAEAAAESTGEKASLPVGDESVGYNITATGSGGRTSSIHATLGEAFFPASSVDAFSVDSPTCTGGFLRSTTCSGVTAAALTKDVVAGRPLFSSTNISTYVLPATDDSCAGAAPDFGAKDRHCLLQSSRFNVATKTVTVSPASLRWHSSGQAAAGIRLPSFLEPAGGVISSTGPGACFRETLANSSVFSSNKPNGNFPNPAYYMLNNTPVSRLIPSCSFGTGAANPRSTRESCVGVSTSPEDLGVIIPHDKLSSGRSQRGNVQVTFSPQMGAWVVWCANGLVQQSRAFSIVALGFEGAKRTAQQYATHCEALVEVLIAVAVGQLTMSFSRAVKARDVALIMSSRRVTCSPGHGLSQESEGTHRIRKETSRRSGSAVIPIPRVTLGLAGPAGGAFNLAKSSSQDFILPKSDFSASRVARLSRRAMELPYVHGVRFEAANFAWVAQMRGEARRFLVKKHGFMKSRLCAIEKVEMWRAALSPEALANELKAEQDVLAMVPTSSPEQANPDAALAVEDPPRFRGQQKASLHENVDRDKFPVGTKRHKVTGMGKAKGADVRPPETALLQQHSPQLVATQPLCGRLNTFQVQGQEPLQHAQQQLLLQPPPEQFLSPIVSLLPGNQKKLVASLQQPLLVPSQSASIQQQKRQLLLQNFGTTLPPPLR
ncbi:hypothetical protein Esti_002356 [Eimeria stiedai]